ncbi:MAG: glycosyltransferase family 4 protein, partial [Bacteroidetes bacterium]|nr:glycosyltransferase family 4 protein [Bacteroidota bacterium]
MKIGMDVSVLPCSSFIRNGIEKLASNNIQITVLGQVKGKYQFKSKYITAVERPIEKVATLKTFLSRFSSLILSDRKRAIDIWSYFSNHGLYSRIKEFNRIAPYYILGFDVIHIQWTKALIKLQYILDHQPCPILVSVRGTQLYVSPISDASVRLQYQQLLPKVSSVHVISAALKEEVAKYTKKPTHLINAAIDHNLFAFIPKLASLSKELKIITVLRFNWIKGLQVLLDAIYNLKKEHIPFKLTIISSDNITEEYIYQIADLGLQEYIEIKYNLSQEKIVNELHSSDLFVLPSLSEGRSNALLEAMSVGIPVICSHFKGADELVIDAQNGWLFDNNDAKSLTEKI